MSPRGARFAKMGGVRHTEPIEICAVSGLVRPGLSGVVAAVRRPLPPFAWDPDIPAADTSEQLDS